MDEKQKKDLKRKQMISDFIVGMKKDDDKNQKNFVKICPCCGQPTCERNDAEKYFKQKTE